MIMKTKRLEFSFEQQEIWQISHSADTEIPVCPLCVNLTPMLTAEKLARTFRISPREIYRQIELGLLHFHETPQSQVFVCLDSFSNGIFDSERS